MKIELSERIVFLSSLLSILIGILLFVSNSKSIIHPVLLLAIIFMVLPGLVYGLRFSNNHPIKSFILVFIPILFINYIYYLTQGDVVGYTDPHFHIQQFKDIISLDGRLVSEKMFNVSFYFVGLYVLFQILESLTFMPIESLASIIPPIFNCICILAVYVIITRLHSSKIGIIAVIFFAWELTVIQFGQEFRTQTLGTLILFTYIILLLASTRTNKINRVYFSIASVPFLVGIVMSSFVLFVSALTILVFTFIASVVLMSVLKYNKITWSLTAPILVLFGVIFFIYLFNISYDYSAFFETLTRLSSNIFRNDDLAQSPASSMPASSQTINLYGPIIPYITNSFYALFAISAIAYFYFLMKNKDTLRLSIYVGFSSLLVLLFGSYFLGQLSVGRTYILILFLFAMCTAWVLISLDDRVNTLNKINNFKFIVLLILLLYVVISVGKMPQYVVGDTGFIRNSEPIDSVPYWDVDVPQKNANTFVENYEEFQYYSVNTLIVRYYSLELIDRLKHQDDRNGGLIAIHDKFYNAPYLHRELIKSPDDFRFDNKIYSNADYVLFSV